MGAHIWWKWLTMPSTPWASLWIEKYENKRPTEELIRISDVSMGSLIWNSAKKHRNLIQQHSFWEVKDGDAARFWEDTWQQLPKLKDLLHPSQIEKQDLQDHNKVKNLWKPYPTQDYRKWLNAAQILRNGTEQAQKTLDTKLMKRKIQCSEEKDILRWGYG